MGLDMYLTAKQYSNRYQNPQLATRVREAVGVQFSTGNLDSVEISIEAAYWRKDNQIHRWFVDNVQNGEDDCGSYYVSSEQLRKLRDACQQVLENHDMAPALLPTSQGFFFGDTTYDEHYFDALIDTAKQIDATLDAFPAKDWEFFYHSSW